MLRKRLLVLSGLLALPYGRTALARDDAADAGPYVGLALDGGVTSFSGGLSKDSHAPTYGAEVSIIAPRPAGAQGAAVGGFRGYFTVGFTTATTTAEATPSFPFDAGHALTLTETSVMPNLCIMADLAVQACLGVGWSQIQVAEGTTNAQSYGSFRGDLRLGRFLDDGLIAGVRGHYYSVAQTVAGDQSHFSALAYEAVLGWQWRPSH